MVIVIETWRLKPEFAHQALELMQQMDEIVGDGAHNDPAWSGHAHFYRSQHTPEEVLMVYPWHSREEHLRLAEAEVPLISEFQKTYCASPREIHYFDELPVDVDDH